MNLASQRHAAARVATPQARPRSAAARVTRHTSSTGTARSRFAGLRPLSPFGEPSAATNLLRVDLLVSIAERRSPRVPSADVSPRPVSLPYHSSEQTNTPGGPHCAHGL